MGRLADARRRARSGGGGGSPPPAKPAAEAVEAVQPGDGPQPEPSPVAAPADFVFPAESSSADEGEGQGMSLPSSGLAEEILARVPAAQQPEGAASEPATAAVRIELPASGLAEDILALHESAPVSGRQAEASAERVAAADVPPAATSPSSLAGGAHSLSFFAAPAQEQRAAIEASEHLATFYLDREEYGVDVRQVQEIRRLTEVTTVPRAPGFIRGVINLRGRILPVLDLRSKLGLGEVPDGRAARIIVVRVRERLLGLLVDGASQVLKVPVSQIEPPPDEVVERGGDYIRGVAKRDERLIILVDLERLLAHELRASAQPAGSRPGLGSEA